MSKSTRSSVSTRITRALIGASSLCLVGVLSLTASAQDLNIDINKSQLLRLPAAASAIVVGNPLIADISVHSPETVFVVARGFGETNVIVLDEFGATMLEANIHVKFTRNASSKRVFHDQAGWRSYDCNPFCHAAPLLSDELPHKVEHLPQVQPIDNTATPIRSSQQTMPAGGRPTSFAPGQNPGSMNAQTQQGMDDYSSDADFTPQNGHR